MNPSESPGLSPVKPERETSYLPTLDGWRALAILGVIVYHGATTVFYPSGPYPSYRALKVIQVGHRGVDVFFALSGFLICTRLLQEYQSRGRVGLRDFYVRRFFRILPPFWLYLAAIAILAAAGLIAVERGEFISSLFFFRNFRGPETGHGWYTGHIWSLSVEEHFYLGWPLFLIVMIGRRVRAVTFAVACLVPLWVGLLRYSGWATDGRGNATDVRIDGLLWGCWVALILAVPAYRAMIARWASPWAWAAIGLALVLIVRYEPPFERHLEAFLLPWLIAGTVLNPGWRVSRLLEARAVRWVGRLSYSLYLWQQLWMFGRFSISRPFDLGPFQELPLNLMCTFLCATSSYYVVERPSIEWGRRLLARRKNRNSIADTPSQIDVTAVELNTKGKQ